MSDLHTEQMRYWAGDSGRDYTDRNALSPEEMNAMYKELYGITRTEMNSGFIGQFDRGMRVLEIGSNVGDQLVCLQNDGFKHLFGIDIQPYAVEWSKSRTKRMGIIEASAFDIPFKDGYFDLVYTSGVLIHIAPEDIEKVVDEMFRCTRRYIWCFEYYADIDTAMEYRGHADLLWKADFCRIFLSRLGSKLHLIKEERFKYLKSDNVDSMFLLEKVE